MVTTGIATFFQSKLEARYGAEAVRLVRPTGLLQRVFLKRTSLPLAGAAAITLTADDSVKAGKDLT
jgi:polar amino acid transport system permease protein